MPILEVVAVERHGLDHDALVGAHLDVPLVGTRNDIHAVDVGGWALGRTALARTLEVWSPELAPHRPLVDPSTVTRIPINRDRPDVMQHYRIAGRTPCGFFASLGVVGQALEFEWLLLVVLDDGASLPLATVRVRRQALRSDFEPTLQPLVLTTPGRSGSTWSMQLLAEHPQIVVQRNFGDTRAAGYWMHMLRILSQPASPDGSMTAVLTNIRSVPQNPFYGPPITDDADTRLWLGRGYPEQLAGFCQRAVEQLYLHTARSQQQSQPRYFAEKVDPKAASVIRELYPDMREIFLVRDFRDLLASILAFDAKRGFLGFGRLPDESDADYIRRFRVWTLGLCRTWRSRAGRCHLVRYEDLVRHPVVTIQGVLDYLQLDATPSLVQRMLERAGADAEMRRHHLTSPSPEASIGRWRQDLAPATRELCQELLADALQEFGYDA